MGSCCSSPSSSVALPPLPRLDQLKTFEDLQYELRRQGLESCNLVIGVDVTYSNLTSGQKSFNGVSLHYIPPDLATGEIESSVVPQTLQNLPSPRNVINPYMKVIQMITHTVEVFDEDHWIPTFYFGDVHTKGHSVASFTPQEPRGCQGAPEIFERYRNVIPTLQFSGPTTFAPLISKAIDIVKEKRDFHILLIICDGQMSNPQHDAEWIVEASNYPLSIVVIGVGDGPWDQMKEFDHQLPRRKFDNFRFVEFNDHVKDPVMFSLSCLIEVPRQFQYLKQHHMLG